MSGKDRADNGKYVETTTPEEVLITMRDAEAPFVTVGDVADVLNCSQETARRKLTELHTDGWVERREVGASAIVWWVPDDGKMAGISRRHGDAASEDGGDASTLLPPSERVGGRGLFTGETWDGEAFAAAVERSREESNE